MEAVEMEATQREWRREQQLNDDNNNNNNKPRRWKLWKWKLWKWKLPSKSGAVNNNNSKGKKRNTIAPQRLITRTRTCQLSPEPEPDNDNAPNQFQPIHPPPINPAIHPVGTIVVSPNALPSPQCTPTTTMTTPDI
jgi:hypothetical protein